MINAEVQNDPSDCSMLKLPQVYVASNPPIFVVWLLKHLMKLWSSGEKLVIFLHVFVIIVTWHKKKYWSMKTNFFMNPLKFTHDCHQMFFCGFSVYFSLRHNERFSFLEINWNPEIEFFKLCLFCCDSHLHVHHVFANLRTILI